MIHNLHPFQVCMWVFEKIVVVTVGYFIGAKVYPPQIPILVEYVKPWRNLMLCFVYLRTFAACATLITARSVYRALVSPGQFPLSEVVNAYADIALLSGAVVFGIYIFWKRYENDYD